MTRSAFVKARAILWALEGMTFAQIDPRAPRTIPQWLRPIVAGLALCLAGAPSQAAPANTLKELFGQLSACFSREADAQQGWRGAEMSLRFSLRRDGSLLGKPHIAYSKLPKDETDKRQVMDSIAFAMDRCLPIKITDGLGGAIAGRTFVYRFAWKGRETGV
jgi:hypothetical protein